MITRLDPPIPLITPKGDAYAYFLMDYSMDHHLLWVCFIKTTGECWTFENPEIKLAPNETFGQYTTQHIPQGKYKCPSCGNIQSDNMPCPNCKWPNHE